jgi:peptidoglycan/xylan/chitin deacetylase (PgdA/CDA1 family)
MKVGLARACQIIGVNRALRRLQFHVLHPFVRAVNYHDVPMSMSAAFVEQLRFYRRHFVPVGYKELIELQSSRWPSSRPGILLSFDDGLRSHAEVVAPLLEEQGFPGWFFVPPGFLDTPEDEQAAFARRNHITTRGGTAATDRVAMTWDEVRRLDRCHIIGCHTLTHRRLTDSTSVDALEREVEMAKLRLEEEIGHPVAAFAWVGGEEGSYSRAAACMIRKAGFEVSFMTNSAVIRPGADPFELQRTNVEAFNPPELLQFQLSGLVDVLYLPKRRRIRQLTNGAPDPAEGPCKPASMSGEKGA